MLGCLDYPEGDRLALRYQMSDLSPKHCPPSLLNPAHRGRDQVSPARMARSFYDTGKKCGAMTVPASSLHLSLIGRQSRRRARGRELPEGPWRFEIVCSEILPSLWPTFWSRPERQKACCLRHLSAD